MNNLPEIYFERVNDKNIFCRFSKSGNSKKLIIMCHGFRGSSLGPARTFENFTGILINNGFSVFRFDQPGSGHSDGDFKDSSFNEWINTLSYFVQKFAGIGYEIALLGQSMGATVSIIVAASFQVQIKCLLLWVPDPKSDFQGSFEKIYEEEGEKYKGSFWQEAKNSDFFACLKQINQPIHLVYGQTDKYISPVLKEKVIQEVTDKKQPTLILPGEDHSKWSYETTQKVYDVEVEFLKAQFY